MRPGQPVRPEQPTTPEQPTRPAQTRVRRPVAVIVSRFPRITETFILRELIELERQGQPVRLVPLLREDPEVVHPEAVPWIDRALFTPFLSPGIAGANLRALRRDPGGYLAVLGLLVRESLGRPGLLLRTLALFPKAVFLAERLKAEGIRHVHAHFATHPTTVALVVERLAGIGFSFTAHAHDIFVCQRLLGEKIRRARFVRAISDFNRRYLETRYPDAAGKTHVIRVGIDPDAYAPESGPTPAKDAIPTILCVAALKPYKGIAVLLEAAYRLTAVGVAFRCLVIGEGPLRGRLEARVKSLGLRGRARLLGARPQGEVATRLRASDIFVLPSVVAPDGQMEGIPVALMEAMAAGRPVVASVLSGIPELVTNGEDGLLVPPGDARALADALRRILDDRPFARGLGEAGRRTVGRLHRLDRSVSALLERFDAENEPPAETARELTEAAGWPGRPVGLRWLREGEDSRTAAFLVEGGSSGRRPAEVIVKRHLARPGQSADPLSRARHEYEVLSWLASVRDDARADVPRPLRLDEATHAVVMEPCGGEPLDELIRRYRAARNLEPLCQAFQETGRWLGRFQSNPVPGGVAWAHPDASREPERALGRDLEHRISMAIGSRPTVPVRRPLANGGLQEGLRRLVAAAAAQAGPPVPCHGDFWPGNVYVDGSTVRAVDFEGYRADSAWQDAGYFLAHAEGYFVVPGQRRRFRRLEAAFLEGFLEARGDPWPAPAALRLCRAAAMARLLTAGAPRTVVERLRRRLLARRLLRELEGLGPPRPPGGRASSPALRSRAP